MLRFSPRVQEAIADANTIHAAPQPLTVTLLIFKYILLIMLLQLSHFFLPFIPLQPPRIPSYSPA